MSSLAIRYDPELETYIEQIARRLEGEYPLSFRALVVLLLAGDPEIESLVEAREGNHLAEISAIVKQARRGRGEPLAYSLARERQEAAERILAGVIQPARRPPLHFAERLSQAMMNPTTGVPILAFTVAMLYLFVGVLGAQILVQWIEGSVFEGLIQPWTARVIEALIPWQTLQSLFVGPYGVVTLGLRYAIAIILPVVATFFLAFSLIEDSGYLPRLAMLVDRLFKGIGLNGRAVIPMALGFGCDTMATIVTRTLETTRERVISTLLLALAVPCSAQLGVILAILSGHPWGLAIWAGSVAGIFLLVGFLTAKLLPGDRPSFFMELPPLRLPRLTNVLSKTFTRVEWYLWEVLPVFVLVSVLIWLGQMLGLFEYAVGLLKPAVRALGLPEETAVAFLFGFFRRDYGAAGLFDLRELMSGVQRTVAAVTLTIFLPCIAQMAVMLKERGWRTAVAVAAFILPFAFLIGWTLSRVLNILGVSL